MTDFQRDNLIKLRDYLAALPEDYKNFCMSEFALDNNDPSVIKEGDCNTPACMVGHGPSAGIPIDPKWVDVEPGGSVYINWTAYSWHNFTVCGDAWDFLFSEKWPDDIAHGVARINYWLGNGLTPDFVDECFYVELDFMDSTEDKLTFLDDYPLTTI